MKGACRFLLLGVSILSAAFFNARAGTDEPDVKELLSRVSEALSDFGTIQGTFTQEVEMVLMGEVKRYSGKIYYRHPDRLRLEYDEPAGQFLVCDGSFFWMFLTDQERPQVIKTPVGEKIGGFLSQRTVTLLQEKYTAELQGEEKVTDVQCYKIYFEPIGDPDTPQFLDLTLWFAKEDLLSRRLSYGDTAGNRIIYEFYGWTAAGSLPGDLFMFSPSSEVELFEDLLTP